MTTLSQEREFRAAYGAHRAAEGRALDAASMRELPYLTTGAFARQWAVRACTYDAFVARVLVPMAHTHDRPLCLLDLGAGNGWLSWRTALSGHEAVAIDVRDDDVDGLRAGSGFLSDESGAFERVAGSFESLPVDDGCADIVVYNASLHYALDLSATLREARRVLRSGGRIAILDSPFYRRAVDGDAMVVEKLREAVSRFGERAEALMSMPFIEYLTRERLVAASEAMGLTWLRHRVRYPLWYEMRQLAATIRGQRVPSRFDLWEGVVA